MKRRQEMTSPQPSPKEREKGKEMKRGKFEMLKKCV
jgi:hypothetical protein